MLFLASVEIFNLLFIRNGHVLIQSVGYYRAISGLAALESPPGNPFGPIKNELRWITIGSGLYGDERGYVAADVGPSHVPVTFHFNNPARGTNTCGVEPTYGGSCTITRAVHAQATFTVVPSLLADGGDANGGDEGDNSDDTP
jgi:hypothetical protein